MATDKERRLRGYLGRLERCAIAFSGGTDSSFLLYAALACGADVRPYYVRSVFQPRFELQAAEHFAASLGADLAVVDFDVLSVPRVVENTTERCYLCKYAMFSALRGAAKSDGREVLLDGTNASDIAADRPGMRALSLLSVLSPLRECEITKDEVRRLSKKAGLPTWNLPSNSCLATRIPCGTRVTKELLEVIEGAESAVQSLGFAGFRVRVWNGAARLQFLKSDARAVFNNMDEIRRLVGAYFDTVLLDMEWR